MLVLLAEDEGDLAELTIDFLATADIECDYAFNGEMALNLIAQQSYDVLVLDVTMPKVDGFAVCQQLKMLGDSTPIIFLTARDNLDDKLTGFALGADDYLTKPFELEELVARIKVLAKKNIPRSHTFQLNNLYIDFNQQQVKRAEQTLTLSKTQWQLLTLLAQNSPNVVSKIAIEDAIWPQQQPSKAMYKTLIFRLRNLIDLAGEQPLIQTIRGSGIALRACDE